MKQIKWSEGILGVWAVVLSMAFLCGCGTTLVKVGEISDDHAAYLVRGALGQFEAQQESAQRIVDAEYARRLASVPVSEVRNLPLWQKRLKTLSAPVPIETSRFERAPELRDVTDRNRVTLYIQANPDKLSLNGAEYSTDWTAALAQAEEQVGKLKAEHTQLIQQMEAALSARDYAKALTALASALEIEPDEELAARGTKMATTGWTATKAALEKNLAETIPALLASATPASKALDAAEKSVLQQQDALITYIRLAASSPAAKSWIGAERLKEAAPLLQRSGESLGEIWEKVADSLARQKNYWGLYQALSTRVGIAQSRPALKSSGVEAKAKTLYARQLVDGMSHFIEAASEAYGRDQYGLSYIYCLMAEEMRDYGVSLKIALPDEVPTRLEFARSIEKDALEKIAAQHSRRLLILDFLPAVTEEGGQIAYQGRTLCNKKYAGPNDLAWRLNVPQGKVLSQNMVEPIDPADTLVSGEIKEITINALPPREYDQQFIEVGSENIIEVVNPLYKIRDNQTRTIYQQEVAKFYQIKREHRKEGILSLMLYGERTGQPPATLLSLNTRFPTPELPLTSLAMQCEEISFAQPIPGVPRTAAVSYDLIPDPYPQNVPVKLASDKEITKAVLDFALKKIDEAIEQLVVQYPITELAAPAVTAQKSGDQTLSAELWGQFILYVRQLAESTLPENERAGASWTDVRGQMEKNLSAWSASRWKGQSPAVLKELAKFWANATQSALLAQDKGTEP